MVLDSWRSFFVFDAEPELTPREALSEFVRVKLDYALEQPELSRIFTMEVLSGGARLVQLGASGPVSQTQPPLARAEDPAWARTMILEVGEGMAASEFAARDLERRCRRCPARFACPLQPEGQQR